MLWCAAVCCSVLQCVEECYIAYVAVRCSVLQRDAVCCRVLQCIDRQLDSNKCCLALHGFSACCRVLQCVAVCCSVLQSCVAVCCSHVLQCVAVMCCSVSQCVAVCCRFLMCCRVLHCVAVCCSVLPFVAVCCSVFVGTVTRISTVSHSARSGAAKTVGSQNSGSHFGKLVYCSVLQRVAVCAVCCSVL